MKYPWGKIFYSNRNIKSLSQIFCYSFSCYRFNFFDKSFNLFLLKFVFFTKLEYQFCLLNLFSTTVRPVVAKFLILGILFLTSFVLALRAVVAANLVILNILLLTSFIFLVKSSISSYVSNISYFLFNIFDLSIIYFFLTKSFLVHHLVYLN